MKRIVIRVPPSGASVHATCPPWAWITCLTMASPRPAPPSIRFLMDGLAGGAGHQTVSNRRSSSVPARHGPVDYPV